MPREFLVASQCWFPCSRRDDKITRAVSLNYSFFLKDFIYLFLERGKRREKERERNIDLREKHQSVASRRPPAGDLAHNPGMCPDWESNQRPFSSQAGTQSTEPQQPGLTQLFLKSWQDLTERWSSEALISNQKVPLLDDLG